MPEQWGYTSEGSQLEFGRNGLSNVYNKNKTVSSGPEYITIYDSEGTFKSKMVSVVLILAVLGFCGLLFSYMFGDKHADQKAAQASVIINHEANDSF